MYLMFVFVNAFLQELPLNVLFGASVRSLTLLQNEDGLNEK